MSNKVNILYPIHLQFPVIQVKEVKTAMFYLTIIDLNHEIHKKCYQTKTSPQKYTDKVQQYYGQPLYDAEQNANSKRQENNEHISSKGNRPYRMNDLGIPKSKHHDKKGYMTGGGNLPYGT